METSTSLNQLFKNLCHHTIWKYAILWKFQHQNHMILTCEEAYATDLKSGSLLEMVVSNMTKYSYLLGEGIVGKVASMMKHTWICVGEDTKLILECPEEFRLQIAAGIKTVLLLPVFPLGVVQLGSFDQLSEDLTLVAELENFFFDYHSTSDFNSTFEMRMNQTLSVPLTMSQLQKHSASSFHLNSELTDLASSQSQPQLMLHSCDPLSQDSLHIAHGLGSDLLDEINWNSLCSELFRDPSEDSMLDLAMVNGSFGSSDRSSLSYHEKELPFICHGSNYEMPLIYDPFMQDFPQHGINLCPLKKDDPEPGEKNDVHPMASRKCNKNVDSGLKTVLPIAIQQNYSVDRDSYAWIENQSKCNQGNESISTLGVGISEPIGYTVEDSSACMKENILEYLTSDVKEILHDNLLDDMEINSCKPDKSCCSSSGRRSESCLTHYKTEDSFSEGSSVLQRQKSPFLTTDAEGFTGYTAIHPSRRSVSVQPANGDHDMIWKSSKISHHGSKLPKNRDLHRPRPRPRDRQLIQDRIKELRELVPNTSKCSIDVLLEQTVKHMMFLQSVPLIADKLSKSGDREKYDGLETKSKAFPLNVENLDQPDQMLVEMQCRNHVLFLKIAQTITRLGLQILKGVLRKRPQELWAHFIVEVPKGFHRMDIFWPLMQLLQFNF